MHKHIIHSWFIFEMTIFILDSAQRSINCNLLSVRFFPRCRTIHCVFSIKNSFHSIHINKNNRNECIALCSERTYYPILSNNWNRIGRRTNKKIKTKWCRTIVGISLWSGDTRYVRFRLEKNNRIKFRLEWSEFFQFSFYTLVRHIFLPTNAYSSVDFDWHRLRRRCSIVRIGKLISKTAQCWVHRSCLRTAG